MAEREGFVPEEALREQEKTSVEKPKFHETAQVNGIEISVGWDSGYDDYTIHLPQIEIGDKAPERRVHDQVLRLTRRADVAEQIYNKAVELAETTDNVYELYRQINEFSRDLPYDTDEDIARREQESQAEKKEKEIDKSYHASTVENGYEISVGWDSGYDDYTIYLPQIEIGDKARERGVHDQVRRLTRRADIAEQIYNKAVELAKDAKDIYDLYQKVDEFSRDLPYDAE